MEKMECKNYRGFALLAKICYFFIVKPYEKNYSLQIWTDQIVLCCVVYARSRICVRVNFGLETKETSTESLCG